MHIIESTEEEYLMPEEGDYVISDSGKLGSLYSVSICWEWDSLPPNHRFYGEYATYDEATNAIREHMARNKFYPNVWYLDDHGGLQLVGI